MNTRGQFKIQIRADGLTYKGGRSKILGRPPQFMRAGDGDEPERAFLPVCKAFSPCLQGFCSLVKNYIDTNDGRGDL